LRIKKVSAAALALVLLFCFSSCGHEEQPPPESGEIDAPVHYIEPVAEKLVIYTVSKDLEKFAERYTSQTGVLTQVKLISSEEYLSGGIFMGNADVIAADQYMLPVLYENGSYEELTHYGTTGKSDALLCSDTGMDARGVLRAICYQLPVSVIVYRRDLANEIFGTDDPWQTAMLFCDYLTITETAKKVREKGCYIFSGTDGIENCVCASEAWVCDGKLNLSKARLDYLNAAAEMYQEELLPMGDTPKDENVFAYSLPAWEIPCIDAKGGLGLCPGPGGYMRGTWIGISAQSENKQRAWEFVEFVALNEQTAQWSTDTTGRPLCLKSVQEALRDFESPDFGGQKIHAFLMDEAQKAGFSPSIYDKAVSAEFSAVVSALRQGLLTKAEAIDTFLSAVSEIYPQLDAK